MKKMSGRKYWWLPASIAFGPSFMVFGPRLVDHELLQMAFVLVGLSMQTCVNMHFFRKIREHDTKNDY